ncbi:hypothetical protein GF325_02275 [Candidatus Bathyarchaeota archaeon]|nr:hypothetical protein [Candidatus Bathyarchaeota archaeon]
MGRSEPREPVPVDKLKALCKDLELKPTKRNRILVQRLVDKVGLNIQKLRIALRKAKLGK